MNPFKKQFLAFFVLIFNFHLLQALDLEELKNRLHLPVPEMTFQEKLKCTLSEYLTAEGKISPFYTSLLKDMAIVAGITSALSFVAGKAAQKMGIKNFLVNSLSKKSVSLGLGCLAAYRAYDVLTLGTIKGYVSMYGGPRAHPWLMAQDWFRLKLPNSEKNMLLELPYKEFAEILHGPGCQGRWESEFIKYQEYAHMLQVKQQAIWLILEHNQEIENKLKNS